MTTVTNFSRFRILVRLLTHCRCQSRNVILKATVNHHLHKELSFPIQRLCMKLQQNGQQYYNRRLLTTSTDAQPNKDTDTFISGLPYDTLDYDPKFTYIFVVHEIADKIEKSLPFKRPLFCRLMKLLEKQEYVNLAEARILLDSTGMTNISFPDAKRAEFTRWVWNKIQENGEEAVKNDIQLFNIYMKVLLENKAPLTPSEIAAEIEARQLIPNRITYLMMIASACERGEMEEVSKQLDKMKKLNYPISIRLYNTLMRGYCKAGYVDRAEEMLQSIGLLNLAANDLTYANLMLCYAEKGDVAKIEKLIEDMEEAGIALNQHKSLEMIVLLANGGYSKEAEQVLEMLKVKIRPEISDISWAITSLLHNGHYKLAFKLDSLLGICSGKFFGEFALVCNVPADDIARFARRCQGLKYRESDLRLIIKEAGFYGEFDTALALCKHLDKTEIPELNQLFLVIQYYCLKGNLDDLLRLQSQIEKMNIWDYITAMEALYSAMRKLGKTCEEVVQILKEHNTLEEGEFNTAMIRTLLCKETLPVVKAEFQKMKTVENVFLTDLFVSPLILNFLQKPKDWREVFEFVVEIKKKRKFEQNCYFVFEEAKKQLLESDMSLEPLVDFMIQNKLKVIDFNREFINAPGVSKEKVEQIELDREHLSMRQYSPRLEEIAPENSFVLRHYLERAASNMDRRTVEGFLQSRRLTKDVFIGIPSKLAVIDMYAELSDPDSALFHITDLLGKMLEFKLPPHIVLNVAVALYKDNRYEEALDVLSTHPTSERVMEKYRDLRRKKCHRCLKQLLQPDQEPELYNRLVAVLVKSNFMKDPTKSDSPLEFMQDSDAEVQKILASEGEVKKLTMDKIQMVFQHLIKKDQKDELQKASDLFCKHKSGKKVLYRLCAAFALEGNLFQARKVLQHPDIIPDQKEIWAICQNFIIERTPISSIENFQDVLKNTGYRFDPDKEVLFTLFKRSVHMDLAKGLEFLENGFEAQGEAIPMNAYRYLSTAYRKAGKPIPFKMPFDQIDRGTAETTGKKKTINSGRNIKKRRQKKNKASEDTEVAWKKSELIEAPVSHIIEMTEAPGSDIIEKGEEIKAVMEQSDPAVEITEIEEPVNKVLNPTTSS